MRNGGCQVAEPEASLAHPKGSLAPPSQVPQLPVANGLGEPDFAPLKASLTPPRKN